MYSQSRDYHRKPPGFPKLSDYPKSWPASNKSMIEFDPFSSKDYKLSSWSAGDNERNLFSSRNLFEQQPYQGFDYSSGVESRSNSWSQFSSDTFGPLSSWKNIQNIWGESEMNSTKDFASVSGSMNYMNSYSDPMSTNGSLAPSKNGYRPPRMRRRMPSCVECVFCKNNGSTEEVYRSHILKDPEGNILCPTLRAYNCPICNNGGGNKAHTIRYCPQNRPNGWRKYLDGTETPTGSPP